MDWLWDIFFPKKCLLCGCRGSFVCGSCIEKLEPGVDKCPMCGQRSYLGVTHPRCFVDGGMEGLRIEFNYKQKEVKKLILGVKYRLYKGLVAEMMEGISVDGLRGRVDLIVPIPLHRVRQNWRGFNQAEEIGKILALKLGVECFNGLKRIRRSKPLAETKEKNERERMVKGIFAATLLGKIEGKRILLVDDVFTSGATMREATRQLKERGVMEVWGYALAG